MEHIKGTSDKIKKRSYILNFRTNSCYPRCHLIYLPFDGDGHLQGSNKPV